MTIFKPISKVWVITSKYAYMQTIQDLARLEYFWYSQGEFPIEKFLKVYESLIRKYPLFSDKNSVFRARKAGKIVGRLMFWRVNEKTIHFTMMFQGSEEQILALYRSNGSEIPQNVNNKFSRLEITTYELCKHMRSSRDKNGEKSINSIPSWTWQYKAGDLQSLRDRLLDSIGRNHNEEVYRVIANLAYAPGFAVEINSVNQPVSIKQQPVVIFQFDCLNFIAGFFCYAKDKAAFFQFDPAFRTSADKS